MAELFGKLSDLGKMRPARLAPKPRVAWESRAGGRSVAPAKISGASQWGWGVGDWRHHEGENRHTHQLQFPVSGKQ